MAIHRRTYAKLIAEVRRNIGQPDASLAQVTDANIEDALNSYLQNLSARMASIVRSEGKFAGEGTIHFDMWKTEWSSTTDPVSEGTFNVTAGSATVYLPDNLDQYDYIWDVSAERKLEILRGAGKETEKARLKNVSPSHPEAIEIIGFEASGNYWVRSATLYPAPPKSLTPVLKLYGWRLPATGGTHPDIDPRFERLLLAGTIADLLRADDPSYTRFKEEEKELTLLVAHSARLI